MDYSVRLQNLVGSSLQDAGRSCDLLWFEFTKPEMTYFLHFQCFLRLLSEDAIFATSAEMYRPYDEKKEDFEWDRPGDALYDYLMEEWLTPGVTVVRVEAGKSGDLRLYLSNGMRIEAMNDSSQNQEIWRMLERDGKRTRHTVYPYEFSEENFIPDEDIVVID